MVKQAVVVIFLVGLAGTASGEEGNAVQGRAFAQKMCVGCHAVEPGQPASPLHTAPSFTAVADTPGMSALALNAFFRTSHKNMPNFIMATRDIDDVSAYILSLKTPKR